MRITLPDGRVFNFPDGMSQADMGAAIQAQLAREAAAPQANQSLYTPANAGMFPAASADNSRPNFDESWVSGVDPIDPSSTAGWLDQGLDIAASGAVGLGRGLMALVGLPGTASDLFDRGMSKITGLPQLPPNPLSGQMLQADLDRLTGGASAYQPQSTAGEYARAVGEFIPGAMLPGATVGNALRYGVIPGLASEAAGQATEGTQFMGVNVEPWARAGAGIGAGLLAAPRRVMPTGTLDDLRSQAGAIYDQADQAAPMPRTGLLAPVSGAIDDAQRLGMDDMLTPQASRVANNLTDAATDPAANVSFRELEILRRQSGIPAGNIADRAEAAIGTRFIQSIDEFIDGASPALAEKLTAARDMWARLRRSEAIDTAMVRAADSATGYENGLRTQFRAILNSPAKLRGFQPAEIAAIRAVVRGTPAGNLFRLIGTMGIELGSGRNFLGAAIGVAGGQKLAPGLTGLLLPIAGTAARQISNAMTRAAASRAQAAIVSGRAIPSNGLLGASGAVSGLLAGPQ